MVIEIGTATAVFFWQNWAQPKPRFRHLSGLDSFETRCLWFVTFALNVTIMPRKRLTHLAHSYCGDRSRGGNWSWQIT